MFRRRVVTEKMPVTKKAVEEPKRRPVPFFSIRYLGGFGSGDVSSLVHHIPTHLLLWSVKIQEKLKVFVRTRVCN